MKILRTIEIEEVSGMWVLTAGESSKAYPQDSASKGYMRFIKDLLRTLELNTCVEVVDKI